MEWCSCGQWLTLDLCPLLTYRPRLAARVVDWLWGPVQCTSCNPPSTLPHSTTLPLPTALPPPSLTLLLSLCQLPSLHPPPLYYSPLPTALPPLSLTLLFSSANYLPPPSLTLLLSSANCPPSTLPYSTTLPLPTALPPPSPTLLLSSANCPPSTLPHSTILLCQLPPSTLPHSTTLLCQLPPSTLPHSTTLLCQLPSLHPPLLYYSPSANCPPSTLPYSTTLPLPTALPPPSPTLLLSIANCLHPPSLCPLLPQCSCLCVLASSSAVAVGSETGHVLVLSLLKPRKPALVSRLYLYHGPVSHLAHDREARFLVVAGKDSPDVYIIDARPASKFQVLGRLGTFVSCSLFSLGCF